MIDIVLDMHPVTLLGFLGGIGAMLYGLCLLIKAVVGLYLLGRVGRR